MSYLAHSLKRVAAAVNGRRAVVGVPCVVRSVNHGIGLVERVVPKDVRVAVGDGYVVVSHVHLSWVVELAQRYVDFLCVAHERDSVISGFLGKHLHRLNLHAVPQRVERQPVVVNQQQVLTRRSCLEPYVERRHVDSCRKVRAHKVDTARLHLL